ncbi:MAG: exonuclease SbcCD subunit D C-terminal domain-containing protein [Verrucomicrobia bacterium]|nr:exonuclease SbcCD subunit D C-terminal domain-containing protein [Verrucomicrobiota bacterium]
MATFPLLKPKGVFRVIHTADWHLGKPLADLDRTEEFRRFLAFLLETVLATETDALVVAGDVFDCATPPQSAVRLYFDFLAALYHRTRCVAVVTAGNHDSPSHLDAPRDLLNALRVRVVAALEPDRSGMLIPLPSPENPALVVAAVPFLRERDLRTGRMGQSAEEIERDLREGLRCRYEEMAEAARPWRERGVPILATGHLTALGASTSESEREIHVGGLGKIGADAFSGAFAYVALGHLHRPQAVGGMAHIRYSGSPIALSFSEAADTKELRILDFAAGGLVANGAIPIPQSRCLVALRLPQADWEKQLRDFVPPPSALPPWVEVVIEGASRTGDLYKEIQGAAEGRPFQVIKVTAEYAGAAAALGLGDAAAQEEAENLLSDPKAVFRRRVEQEAGLDAASRAALEIAFAELYERHLEGG